MADSAEPACRHCKQEYGQNDKDSPPDHPPVIVSRAKPTASICHACFYIQRGSFQANQTEMSKHLAEHSSVAEKFAQLRAAHVEHSVLHPSKKSRHEKVLIEQLVKKSEQKYVDFQQVSKLVPLKQYLDEHLKVKKKFKSDKERKAYINTLKLTLQKDPSKNNALCVPVAGDTLMLAGVRMAAERVKKESHDTKEDAKESFKRAAEEVQATTNSKEEIERAQKEQENMEKSSQESSSSDSSSSDSEKSSFGCASEKASPSPKRLKRKSAGAKSSAKPKSSAEKPRHRITKKSGPGDNEKLKAACDMAEKYVQTIKEIKCDTLWRSCIRIHEVDRRVAKETSTVSALKTAMESDQVDQDQRKHAEDLIMEIENQCRFIRNMKDFCRLARSMKVEEFVAEASSTTGSLIKCLSQDDFAAGQMLVKEPMTLRDIMHFAGKKLLDAFAPVFFEFIQTYTSVETPSQSFRFQWFLTTLPFAKQDKNRLWATLLQTQQNLVNECFDRIRCGATLDSLQAFVPKALKTADLGDPKRWLPKSEHVDQLEEFQNENGLCCQSMQDLQKVLVCLELHGSNMEKADKRFIATVAGFSGFSPKVSDAIGAQPDWRCLWQKALKLRLDSSLSPEALQEAEEMVSWLEEAARLSQPQAQQFDFGFPKRRDPASMVPKLQHALLEGAPEVGQKLEKAIADFEAWIDQTLDPNFERHIKAILTFGNAKIVQDISKTQIKDLAELNFEDLELPEVDPFFFIRCNILKAINLPNQKPDPLTDMMLEWRELVSTFEEPEGDSETLYIKAYMKAAGNLHCACKDALEAFKTQELQHVEEEKKKAAAEAVGLINDYALGICTVASAKSVILLAGDPKAEVCLESMVMKEFQPFATALQGLDKTKEQIEKMKALSPPSLKELLSYVSSCEEAASLLSSTRMNEDSLNSLKTVTQSLLKSFDDGMLKELSGFDETVHILQGFIKKYGPLADAAKSWQMDPVKARFKGEGIKTDFNAFHEQLKELEAVLPVLDGFANHRSSDQNMVKLINKATNLSQLVQSTRTQAQEIAGMVMLSGFFIDPDGMELSTVLTFAQKTYQLKEDHLPAKLAKMVQDAKEKEKSDAKKPVKKDKLKDKKEKGTEKKEKGTEKKEKGSDKSDKKKDKKKEK